MKKFLIFLMAICFNLEAYSENQQDDSNESDTTETMQYICEGTKWTTAFLFYEPPFKVWTQLFTEWIDGTEIINGKQYMKVWKALSDHMDSPIREPRYIRVEGEKLYQLNPAEDPAKEYLLFDYSLEQGETLNLNGIVAGEITQGIPIEVSVSSVKDETQNDVTLGIMIMNLTINPQSERPTSSKIKWIKGIGSEAGFLNNYAGNNISAGQALVNVYHNDKLIYKATSSDVDRILNDAVTNNLPNKRYHLDGREFKKGDKGVYIEGNKKYIQN